MEQFDSLNLEVEASRCMYSAKKMIYLLAGGKVFAKYRAATVFFAAITKYSEFLISISSANLLWQIRIARLSCTWTMPVQVSRARSSRPTYFDESHQLFPGTSRADRSRNKRDLDHGCPFYESALMKDFCFEEFETWKLSPWLPFLL